MAGVSELPFQPSVSAQPSTRVPDRLTKLIAIDKALRKIAMSPSLVTAAVRQSAEDAAVSYQSAFIPLKRNAAKAHQADYILALSNAGDRNVTPELAASSGNLANVWVAQADKVLATVGQTFGAALNLTAWVAGVTGDAQTEAANVLKDALKFWGDTAAGLVKKANDAAADALGAWLRAIPWYVWAVGGLVVLGALVYVLAPLRMAASSVRLYGVGTRRARRALRHWRR